MLVAGETPALTSVCRRASVELVASKIATCEDDVSSHATISSSAASSAASRILSPAWEIQS